MIPVLTALGNPHEARIAALLGGSREVEIIRRCADLAELLAASAVGLGSVALVSHQLRGLDLAAIERLHREGMRVVGVSFATGPTGTDDAAQSWLLQIGVDDVVAATAELAEFESVVARVVMPVAAVRDAADTRPAAGAGPDLALVDVSPSRQDPGGDEPVTDLADRAEPGIAVAVWGPIGSPGRTTLAVNLAAEIAEQGYTAMVFDADTYAASVAQVLSLLDEAPGIAAACRLADQGHLDKASLSRVAPEVSPGLRVLTGIPRADRWPELRPAAVARVLALARELVDVVVVDTGFSLEDDEELSYDTLAPRRNGATLTVLERVDRVVVVGLADPVGLARLVRGVQALASVHPEPPLVVVNRVRASAVGAHPTQRIAESLQRFAGIEATEFISDERAIFDAALLDGRLLVESAPDSAARAAIRRLVAQVLPGPPHRTEAPRRRRSWRGRRP